MSVIAKAAPEIRPLILTFLGRLAQRMTSIEEAFTKGDFEIIESESHKLRMAGSFGYDELSSVAGRLEESAKLKDLTQCTALMDRIRTLAADAIAEGKSYEKSK